MISLEIKLGVSYSSINKRLSGEHVLLVSPQNAVGQQQAAPLSVVILNCYWVVGVHVLLVLLSP